MGRNAKKPASKFGTFLGVYTPSVLTILGMIMFLRSGWVVGNVGLGWTIVIVLLSSSITFITGLSASAIATNINIGVGGEYFLISRSLGKETGGAVGIPLYFCRTLSVTFYCFGLAEALLLYWPIDWPGLPYFSLQAVTAVLIVLVTLLSGKSASLTLKTQVPIMVLVGLSILALAGGVFTNELRSPLMEADYATADEGFWYVFAVFFPAVTGFTAGIGMSGDLKDPRKSIPKGTLWAVITGTGIYLFITVLFAITGLLSVEQLTDKDFGLKSWTSVAMLGGVLVIPAVWGALLSSTFGSILGGPRVLQALSMDGLAPRFLSRLSRTGQPTYATWITGAIALMAVTLGSLNTIAQLISVLFLTIYTIINTTSALETIVAEPYYRPKIKVPWYISIAGALGSIGAMFLINAWACVLALLIVSGLYLWLRSRSLEQEWGDVSAGFWLMAARVALLQLKSRKIHGRNWRPLMLLFARDIDTRHDLIKLAEQLGQNHGILTVAQLHYTDQEIPAEERDELEAVMKEKLKAHGFSAFCEVHPVSDLEQGIVVISRGHGVAGLRTNTVVLGWAGSKSAQEVQMRQARKLQPHGKNLLICRFNKPLPATGRMIDIWWGGLQNNGDLMLLLAYLLKLNRSWENANIRIFSVASEESQKKKLYKGIRELLPQSRIQARVEVLASKLPFRDILYDKSGSSDLVFLGLPEIEEGKESGIADQLSDTSSGLRAAIFVKNNSMSEGIPILLKI